MEHTYPTHIADFTKEKVIEMYDDFMLNCTHLALVTKSSNSVIMCCLNNNKELNRIFKYADEENLEFKAMRRFNHDNVDLLLFELKPVKSNDINWEKVGILRPFGFIGLLTVILYTFKHFFL